MGGTEWVRTMTTTVIEVEPGRYQATVLVAAPAVVVADALAILGLRSAVVAVVGRPGRESRVGLDLTAPSEIVARTAAEAIAAAIDRVLDVL